MTYFMQYEEPYWRQYDIVYWSELCLISQIGIIASVCAKLKVGISNLTTVPNSKASFFLKK